MKEQPQPVVLGVIEIKEAKRIKAALEPLGVRLELVGNPETCDTGACAPKVEVHARPEDLEKIQEYFQGERSRDLAGLEFDPTLLGEVYDSEKESARCPACGEVFSTQLVECPGCGLCFGAG